MGARLFRQRVQEIHRFQKRARLAERAVPARVEIEDVTAAIEARELAIDREPEIGVTPHHQRVRLVGKQLVAQAVRLRVDRVQRESDQYHAVGRIGVDTVFAQRAEAFGVGLHGNDLRAYLRLIKRGLEDFFGRGTRNYADFAPGQLFYRRELVARHGNKTAAIYKRHVAQIDLYLPRQRM